MGSSREWGGAREGVQSSAARCRVFAPMMPQGSSLSVAGQILRSRFGISFAGSTLRGSR